ncbi:MAG: polysaccharide export protein [Alphaproteobacteria bacterium]|nr:polysaccharide export protein [Alphaproteobacteria bacterium]MDE2336849.1 polysaccharide export protein [Alphaproteobacteria bacterium]
MPKMRSLSGRIFIIASLFLLSACAADPDYSNVAPLPTASAPQAPAAKKLPAYRVQIGDVLDIDLYLNPELSETVTVRPDGMISTKIAENVYVYNKTTSQITAMLKKSYKRILKNPAITTVVRSFAPVRIYVSGEVVSPGEFLVVGQPLTLDQAIARAGGVKPSGLQRDVLIFRRGAGETEKVFVANYYGATQGANPAMDARLAPDDVVFVPKTGAALRYQSYQQNFQQYVNPAVGVGAGATIH